MSMKEIQARYQALMSEHSRVLGSIQAGILSTTEAAIAIADLRGRMNNLKRIAGNKRQTNYAMAFAPNPHVERQRHARQSQY